jgi:CRP-like cAMP-binding protein
VGTSQTLSGNRILDSLSTSSRERLQPHLELQRLARGRQLLDAGDPIRHAYFPVNGSISLLGLTDSGGSVELAAIGAEGFANTLLVLGASSTPHRLVVPIASSAYRISADIIRRESQRSPDLQQLVLRCVEQLLLQVTQSAICLTFHTLLQRIAGWLLACSERIRATTIELTHEFVAQILGVSRPRVSEALTTLESRRLIHQGLGRIHIVNRVGLQDVACDCHRGPANRPAQR